MKIPKEFLEDANAFPPALRALLDAELAAGNQIAEVGHSFPAPPAGAYFKLKGPITTRPRETGGGLKFRDYNSSLYSGCFTDDRGFFHLLEPPLPPPPEPDMDAIRAAHAPHGPEPVAFVGAPGTSLRRFEQSMEMDYEKWHDGIGYDLDALREATPAERRTIETMLIHRGTKDWRDVEALAELDTLRSHKALKKAMEDPDPKIRLAVVRHAPKLVPTSKRAESLVKAIETTQVYSGLSQALDEAEEFHPKEVMDALMRAALNSDGESAVNIAGMLMYLHGKAEEAFDWEQRPFFLRFNTEDREERTAVFRELCEKVGVEASDYL